MNKFILIAMCFLGAVIQAGVVQAAEIQPDKFEPNDFFKMATDLGSADQLLTDMSIHDVLDDDYFLWKAAGAGQLAIDVKFDHSFGDLDIALHDKSLNRVALSDSLTDNEAITRSVVAGDLFFLHVYGFDDATNVYELTIDGPGGFVGGGGGRPRPLPGPIAGRLLPRQYYRLLFALQKEGGSINQLLQTASIPEPPSFLLASLSLLGFAAYLWRK